MKGVVLIEDGAAVHVIPRAEVRHIEIHGVGKEGWELHYILVGALAVRSIQWIGDCRPQSLKTKTSIGEYNQGAARFVQTVITRGYRDFYLERRTDGVFFVRSGLVENDARVVLCRKFITEMALTARQTAIGPLDDARLQMLHEIHAAARDLVLPDWYPLEEDQP